MDWQTKLMQNETGIDWCKRRFISKLYMDQSVKTRLDQGKAKSVKFGRRVRHTICHGVYSSYTENALQKKLLKGLETSK
jgi:hypothetical protein